jgi:hypothetical protein
MTENLINRISFYLASGGLFNPELADHLAVRTLLFECKEALAQRTWVGLTDEEAMQICVDCGCLSEDWLTLLDAIEAKLKEKNGL